jgi:hypothetical protein
MTTTRQTVTSPALEAVVPAGFEVRPRWRLGSQAMALSQLCELFAFAVAPVLLTAVTVYVLIRFPTPPSEITSTSVVNHGLAMDFHGQFWPAGQRVIHGLSPYDLGWQDIQRELAFPYGAVAALLFAPWGLLPHGLADGAFTALCIALAPITLAVMGVRDWRVYGVAMLWTPVVLAWETANVTLLLGLGIALLWRYRDRAGIAGLLLALLVSVKLFVWPLAIWLLATRRYATAGYAVLWGLALNLAAWAVVGFDQIGPYLKVMSLVSDREEPRSDSVLAAALHYGASRPAAYALTLALGAVAAGACIALARRGREDAALLMCIVMGTLVTPVTWVHYFALLIVPLALRRPRFGLVWALPVAMMLCPVGAPATWRLAIVAVVVLLALRPAAPARPAPIPVPA